MNEVTIENIISSLALSTPLDLPRLAETLPLATYYPEETPLLSLTFEQPKAACLLFPNGKIKITGPTSHDDIVKTLRQLRTMLNNPAINADDPAIYHIDQVVASTTLEIPLDLEQVQTILPLNHVTYNPKQFPGVVYTMEYPKTVIVVFTSGKLVALGASLEDVTQALTQVTRDLSILEAK